MISFIVIGRNEERNLQRCFNSILQAIDFNQIGDYEIIYVDSKSHDSSIRIASSFCEIKIFLITGFCNAAIGRNVGAWESKGDILFFIDGDMEISKEFLLNVLNEDQTLKYDIVSGQVLNVIDGIESKCYNKINKTSEVTITQNALGGIFLIKREIWKVGKGMRTKYSTGEESDLAYRLIKKGYVFTFRQEVITKHYTQKNSAEHLWKMILNKGIFYPRCVFYRDHINNKNMYFAIWELDKTFVMLIILAILSLFLPNLILVFFCLYFLALSIRSVKQMDGVKGLKFIPFYFLFDLLNFVFMFSFFPKSKETKYIKVQV